MAGNTDMKSRMGNRIKLFVLAASAAIVIVGCQKLADGPVIEDKVPPARQNISIRELATALGLRVSESKPTHVTLKNSSNTVMIFTLSGGKVYVNTRPIGDVGRVERIGGQIYISKSLIQRIRSAMRAYTPPSRPVHRRMSGTVVIDAGHGGKDPGATSILGFYEKDVNLSVARQVARLLEQRGLRVKMTRTSDYFVELEDRAAIANNLDADLFVSIHSDSFPKSTRRGFTVYIARSASSSSRRAASAIVRSMSCPFDVRHRFEQLWSSDGGLPRPDRYSRSGGPCRVRLPLQPPRSRPAAKQFLPEPPRKGSS